MLLSHDLWAQTRGMHLKHIWCPVCRQNHSTQVNGHKKFRCGHPIPLRPHLWDYIGYIDVPVHLAPWIILNQCWDDFLIHFLCSKQNRSSKRESDADNYDRDQRESDVWRIAELVSTIIWNIFWLTFPWESLKSTANFLLKEAAFVQENNL